MYHEDELIKKRRTQILIHSYLYYELDSPILSDFLYDLWCTQLAGIGYKKIDWYDSMFIDWDGSSGYHLSYDGYIRDKATQILEYHNGIQDEK